MAFPARNAQLCRIEAVRKQLEKVYEDVEKGFAAQVERADRNCDYWDIWNCRLGTAQNYAGNSKVFVPIVRNAVKALRTRFTNQLFPQTGRHVQVISHDDEKPAALVALLEHYVRRSELRTLLIPALITAGQIEGQMTVLVSWTNRQRNVVERIPEPIRVLGIELPEELAEPVIRVRDSQVDDAGPNCEIVLDSDLCIRPATADSIDEALEDGGSVSCVRRYDKQRIRDLIDDGEFDVAEAEDLIAAMQATEKSRDIEKANLDAAGIQLRGARALIYRTWCKIDVGSGRDKQRRLVLAYFGGPDRILSARLCPYWCDKPDVISQAMDKLPGNAKGMSQLSPGVADMQYGANDALNEGLDQLTYALLPPILYDPDKVPNADALILDLQAMWAAPPGSIQSFQFQNTIPQAFEAVAAAERYINMALNVSPAQLPSGTSQLKSKPNQAVVALEQQVALENTDNAVTAIESGIMTPLIERFAAYDAQFRDREKTVQSYGEMGLKVEMVTVPPIQADKRWEFLWYGVEANRTVQRVQQKIAAANVLRGLAQDPSVAQAGKRLNMVPIIQDVVESAFEANLAPRIFEDISAQSTVPVDLENRMLAQGLPVHTAPLDNDPEHMKTHFQLFQQLVPGSLAHHVTVMHLADHRRQMQLKTAMQAQQMMGQMMGQPGGQMPGQGRPPRGGGPPRLPLAGGQPAMPRQGRQPPGRIAQDSMTQSGVIPMPRRM